MIVWTGRNTGMHTMMASQGLVIIVVGVILLSGIICRNVLGRILIRETPLTCWEIIALFVAELVIFGSSFCRTIYYALLQVNSDLFSIWEVFIPIFIAGLVARSMLKILLYITQM